MSGCCVALTNSTSCGGRLFCASSNKSLMTSCLISFGGMPSSYCCPDFPNNNSFNNFVGTGLYHIQLIRLLPISKGFLPSPAIG